MGHADKPATAFLAEYGFEIVSYYNYDHDESVAHVVAHKNIMFSSYEIEQENKKEILIMEFHTIIRDLIDIIQVFLGYPIMYIIAAISSPILIPLELIKDYFHL